MIFISGPRQSGKTTFSKMIAKDFTNSLYFNWDIIGNKRKLLENSTFYEELNRKDTSIPLIILDEIHKYSDWKNYLKGAYDRDGDNFKFMITGSGRLDLYQKGGDSLAGRYLLFHLWPFTLAELCNRSRPLNEFLSDPMGITFQKEKETREIWDGLAERSGFPDPFLSKKKSFYNIWNETYKQQLIREDIRDLTGIQKIEQLEILAYILPSRIGSPLSMNNLSREIKVSFDSIKSWLQAFDDYFVSFRLSPWTKKISRSISKEKKLYLFDYASIKNESAKFENMIALELYRAVTNWTEHGFGKFGLYYIRNKDGEEVDFLITNEGNPILLIECKLSDQTPLKSLKKIQLQLEIPAIQLVNENRVYKIFSNVSNKILIISADQWLATLP